MAVPASAGITAPSLSAREAHTASRAARGSDVHRRAGRADGRRRHVRAARGRGAAAGPARRGAARAGRLIDDHLAPARDERERAATEKRSPIHVQRIPASSAAGRG